MGFAAHSTPHDQDDIHKGVDIAEDAFFFANMRCFDFFTGLSTGLTTQPTPFYVFLAGRRASRHPRSPGERD